MVFFNYKDCVESMTTLSLVLKLHSRRKPGMYRADLIPQGSDTSKNGAAPKSTLIENVNCKYLMDPPSFLPRQFSAVLPFFTGPGRTGSPSLHTTLASMS